MQLGEELHLYVCLERFQLQEDTVIYKQEIFIGRCRKHSHLLREAHFQQRATGRYLVAR